MVILIWFIVKIRTVNKTSPHKYMILIIFDNKALALTRISKILNRTYMIENH